MPKWINKVNESSKSQTKKEKLISEINEVTNECNRMADIILQKLVLVDNKYSDPDEILFSGMAEVIDKQGKETIRLEAIAKERGSSAKPDFLEIVATQ